jgi:Na+/H+ antiporter NhaD/arsenite permease-like protein
VLTSYLTLGIFVLAYVLFVIFSSYRTWIAVGGSLLLIIIGSLSPQAAFFAINWNVMGIFVGTLVLADVFIESRVPAYLAEIIVDKSKSIARAMLFICILTGFISAFVENVATVLIVAPIALALSKKIKANPTLMMIGIAVSSNLQGAATLIGDPPSMLLAGFAKMNFMDFFFYKGKPSIFFAVELGALFSFVILYFLFNRHKEKAKLIAVEKVKSWVPTILLAALIVLLAASSFFDTGFSYLSGIICMLFGGLALLWKIVFSKGKLFATLKALDWDTTLFLMSIFIIVGSLTATGWIDRISNLLTVLIGDNLLLAYTLIILLSVVLSAFIDNVPYLATMLPVAIDMATKMKVEPSLLLIGLLIGASLGGNLTPIGASANIVAIGLLKKEGYKVSFPAFMKIGIPFTIGAVIPAAIFIWFIWR